MKKSQLLNISSAFTFICAMALLVVSCADDDNIDNGNGDKGIAVSFNVYNAQDEAIAAKGGATFEPTDAPATRAAFVQDLARQGLTAEDLAPQHLKVTAPADMDVCLIETTVEGVNPVKRDIQMRAAQKTSIDADFSTLGYRGTTSTGISTTPDYFYNARTKQDGVLYSPILWSWNQRFARFFAIYPLVQSSDTKMKLSDQTYSGTPYVDFEVEDNIANQKDLMTACSGVVEYATRDVAPTTNLNFRHALTAVKFAVGSNLSWNKTITKVEIKNVLSKGRYTLSDQYDGVGSWSAQADRKDFVVSDLNVSTSAAPNTELIGGDNSFLMIPQTLTDNNVQAIITFSDGSNITATLTGTWKAGTTKTYKISNTNSNWEYIITASSPAAIAYDATATGNYTITSYRQQTGSTQQQAVKWEVVGYDANGDGTYSMSEKPSWLASLSKESGDGGTAAETGTAAIDNTGALTDLLAERNNQLKNATAQGSAANYHDLSTAGGSRSTANSYVISAPGYYKLPLVYGNAIKNGATNSNAYKTTATGTYVLTNFKDHMDQNITDPWITQSNGGANIPNGAKIVWADESGLVTNLQVTGSGTNAYLQFQVPQSAIKNGNAVVAVTKGGTVVWSWHLWFAPADVLNTTTVTNFQNKQYSFINETLGFKYTTWKRTSYGNSRSVKVKVQQTVGNGGVKQEAVITITQNGVLIREGYSTLYQFGRKDALPGTNTIAEGSFTQNGGTSMTFQNGIQHPDIFYIWDTNFWVANYNKYNLWSANNTSTGYNDNAVVKTVYDPSPAGFKMPASNAFTGFTTTGANSTSSTELNVNGVWNYGWDFNNKITNPNATLYFPAVGYRGNSNGILNGVGTLGYYWSAIPNNNMNGCYLYFKQGDIRPKHYANNAFGEAVRPVAE